MSPFYFFFFFNDTATTEIYTLSLHDALPIYDLNARAGSHEWGYVEPSEAAWEILEETVEPVLDDMKRHIELGLEAEALEIVSFRQACVDEPGVSALAPKGHNSDAFFSPKIEPPAF